MHTAGKEKGLIGEDIVLHIEELYRALKQVETSIVKLEKQLKALSKSTEGLRLMRTPGVGYLTATILLAVLGDPSVFKRGRSFASCLGLVPRHRASGEHIYMGRISKGGDAYVRTLLIHGARAVLRHCEGKIDKHSLWIKDKKERLGNAKAAVALANKMARECWAILVKGADFKFIEEVKGTSA